jgi:hypothetical protein
MAHPYYTIGHGTRPIDEFIDLLRSAGVALVADVRTVPRSRTNPQYNRDVLPQSLAPFQIAYEHIAALGGLRSKDKDVPRSVNAFWQNDSFHNYADYAMGESYRTGLARLRELGGNLPCAIMCAESLWWRCHRRIIADYLLAAGDTVLHILQPGHIEAARITEAARPQPSGFLALHGRILVCKPLMHLTCQALSPRPTLRVAGCRFPRASCASSPQSRRQRTSVAALHPAYSLRSLHRPLALVEFAREPLLFT